MSLLLGCVADDYTGASDLANTLTRNGLRTLQTIGIPPADLDIGAADALVVALKSRSIAAADAVAQSLAAEAWLRGRGAQHILFKICSTFDSTDAGNIGPVMNALRESCAAETVLVTPAFPETGRTVYQGHLFIKNVPLHESPMKDHPLNPMRDSNLVRVLQHQSGETRIGLVDFSTVSAGEDAIAVRQQELLKTGVPVAIVDAVLDRDLETIGRAAAKSAFSVGASGLGLGLARALRADATGGMEDFSAHRAGGLAACLVGSCSAASLEQIAKAEAAMPVRRLDTERLLAGPQEVADALTWAQARLHDGPVLIASSAGPEALQAVQARHGREASGQAVEQAMAAIAAGLAERGVRRMAIGGGETSGAIVDRLGLRAFEVGPEIAPGVPMLRSVGGEAMMMALKSGNFGGPEFFVRALEMMK
jgi:uncharacterized protein YgbK (DUF1537 family)